MSIYIWESFPLESDRPFRAQFIYLKNREKSIRIEMCRVKASFMRHKDYGSMLSVALNICIVPYNIRCRFTWALHKFQDFQKTSIFGRQSCLVWDKERNIGSLRNVVLLIQQIVYIAYCAQEWANQIIFT